MTSSMRFQYNPEVTFLEDWDRTTGLRLTDDARPQRRVDVRRRDVRAPRLSESRRGQPVDERALWLAAPHLNLRGLVAGSLFVGYDAVPIRLSPEQYVQEVVEGKRFDPNLSKQLKKGFKVRNLIPHYTEEPRTRD